MRTQSKVRCDKCGEWVNESSATRTRYRGYLTVETVKCSDCSLREADPSMAELIDWLNRSAP